MKHTFWDDPCRIYDCSNSVERPEHRGGGGPIMNDIMRYLHEYAEDYYYKFVDSPQDAQVIITNDVFPADIVSLGKPLVKRMCGPFYQNDNSFRNLILNSSAVLADEVIFISEYSRKQYLHCFGDNLKSHKVVLNCIDHNVFFPEDIMPAKHKFTLAACATNWNRKEKRLADLINFAKANPRISFTIIGTVDEKLPKNMLGMGYLSNPKDIAYILNSSDGFINLSYRDAATKTVPQAVSCGLPVLYANSGGVSEMVRNPNGLDFGVAIPDSNCLDMESDVPPLNLEDIQAAYKKYRRIFKQVKVALKSFNRHLAFTKMLDGYFETIGNSI